LLIIYDIGFSLYKARESDIFKKKKKQRKIQMADGIEGSFALDPMAL
jgi:hypothetical protein